MQPDRDLVRALDGVAPIAWKGAVLRHHAPRYGALDGEGARVNGGRWNPPESFPVVYTALDRATVDAEIDRLARRSGLSVESLLPRRLSRIDADLTKVLDLTDRAVRRRLGVTLALLTADDWGATQRIGQAAQFLGFEAILAPGADGGTTLAMFGDALRDPARMSIEAAGELAAMAR
ncbi:MAG TPA: RES family NAD+ phosphorylase [Candidatus Limnocylindria bacterium]